LLILLFRIQIFSQTPIPEKDNRFERERKEKEKLEKEVRKIIKGRERKIIHFYDESQVICYGFFEVAAF
jgi:hypothetical protein